VSISWLWLILIDRLGYDRTVLGRVGVDHVGAAVLVQMVVNAEVGWEPIGAGTRC
jgi:hypothetical protein